MELTGKASLRRAAAFTLIELITVIAMIAFLSRVVMVQIGTGLEGKHLQASTNNMGAYFSTASRLARTSGEWTLVVVNADPNSPGFLRQTGIYSWFNDYEPFVDDNLNGVYNSGEEFVDINGNGKHDLDVEGWKVDEPKGYWLPDKIFVDLERSGAARYKASSTSFQTARQYSTPGKYLQFAMKHRTQVGPDPVEALQVGRLPFFLNRTGMDAGANAGNVPSPNPPAGTGNNKQVDSFLAQEVSFSKTNSSSPWLFFPFDKQGRYVNIESKSILGAAAPQDTQRDFLVLARGHLDYRSALKERYKIKGQAGSDGPVLAAFMIHRSGSISIVQDDNQIPGSF